MTHPGDRPTCPECGAQLRRGRPAGQRCDPCQRTGPHLALPTGFYDKPPLQTALAGYDFGAVFLAIRTEHHWTQQTLAEFIDINQNRISEIERGIRPLRDVRAVARIATRLTIPPGKLGFSGVTVGGGTHTGRKGRWMDRRDFVQHVAGLALGLGAAGVDVDRLLALLPHAEPTGTRRVGAADVTVIEQITAAFAHQDFAHGSELIRDGAVAQLSSVLPLLNAQVSPDVRPRLLIATAGLAMMTGWMSFQVRQHDDARRLWVIGLDIARDARDAGHPLGSDLTAYLLFDMALQAVHLQRPDEALRLVRVAEAAGVGSEPVSASTSSSLASIQARAHAAQGDTAGCDRALGQAVEHFTAIDPATCPPWGAHLNDAGIASHQGAARYGLALAGCEPRSARQAVELLSHAVDHFGPHYAQLRALYLPDLAGAHAVAGDTDTAVIVGHEAVDAVSTVSSPRTRDQLRVLHGVLEPMHISPGVAELRDRLATTAA
ncbi:MAG: helix-turn-helix domain-containing protein [Pseudonocardiaceae bacterium]